MMGAARTTWVRLGLFWSVSLIAMSAMAQDATDIPVPDLPQPVLSLDAAAPTAQSETKAAESAPAIELPDPPAVVVSVPAADSLSHLPGLPEATVAITEADRLRTALASHLAALVGSSAGPLARKEREAIAAFYESQGLRPLWMSEAGWNPAATAVMRQLEAADEDGLDPADYPLPTLAARKTVSPEDRAEAEVKLTASVVAYARDARGARIEPSRLSALITPTLALPEAGEVLARLAGARDAAEALAAYHPPHAGYRALKARLAELRRNRVGRPMVGVPQGRALRVGMRDPRVPLIRARFNLGPSSGDEQAYDERVASAVATFQREKGLPASGVLTPQTIAALGGGVSPARLEGDLIANMERWRWLPAGLGERHIMVNVPEFRLRIVQDGAVVHQTRVIVGKAESPTPIFSDELETVIVNPSWTVPPSIMKKEFLPALATDPTYAERRGYRVLRRGNRIVVQQPPGERNALGFIKFIFPNQHAVYLHDTPSRSLFSSERRAFSHGCVRVDQPFDLAEEILAPEGKWSEAKLRSLIGKGERYITLRQHLPVHLTYFTLAVDEQGRVQTFDDLYGFNRKVKAALGLEG
jgi:murein L,D-transpeptidase YcbB/YkuD